MMIVWLSTNIAVVVVEWWRRRKVLEVSGETVHPCAVSLDFVWQRLAMQRM